MRNFCYLNVPIFNFAPAINESTLIVVAKIRNAIFIPIGMGIKRFYRILKPYVVKWSINMKINMATEDFS